MVCKKCGAKAWDNRAKKASGQYKSTSPDFVCSNKVCGMIGYVNKNNKLVWSEPRNKTAAKSVATKSNYTPKSNVISASYYGAWAANLAIAAVEKKLNQEALAKAFTYFVKVVNTAINTGEANVSKPKTEPTLDEPVEAEPETSEPSDTEPTEIDLSNDLDLGDLDNLGV